MLQEPEIIFREEQKFSFWLRWVVYVSMGVSLVITVFAFTEEPAGADSMAVWEILLGAFIGIGVPIGVAALFYLLKLETEVRPDGLYVRYFPFHIHFKRFGREDLSEYYSRRYKPIREYGGWGIRYSLRNGRAYNTSGDRGVQLVLSGGKKLLIGSQKPDELAEAIGKIL